MLGFRRTKQKGTHLAFPFYFSRTLKRKENSAAHAEKRRFLPWKREKRREEAARTHTKGCLPLTELEKRKAKIFGKNKGGGQNFLGLKDSEKVSLLRKKTSYPPNFLDTLTLVKTCKKVMAKSVIFRTFAI